MFFEAAYKQLSKQPQKNSKHFYTLFDLSSIIECLVAVNIMIFSCYFFIV